MNAVVPQSAVYMLSKLDKHLVRIPFSPARSFLPTLLPFRSLSLSFIIFILFLILHIR